MFKKLFSRQDEEPVISDQIDLNNLPKHIAIIMDGNGRWAKGRSMPRIAGHQRAMETVKSVIRYCSDIGIEYLTVYAFSTENWNRPKDEVDGLMDILVRFLRAELDELNENQVRMKMLGDPSRLPDAPRIEIEKALEKTAGNTGLTFCVALNYGGRDEILRAAKKIATEVRQGKMDPDQLSEEVFERYLYTSDIPDPDLMIRTSGEIRISNFMLWQLAYSELWFTDINWPDFTPEELDRALIEYQNRERRFGKI